MKEHGLTSVVSAEHLSDRGAENTSSQAQGRWTVIIGDTNEDRTLIYPHQLLNPMADITFPDHFTKTANDIRTMRTRGAGKIARTAAKAIADLANSYQGQDLKEFRSYLDRGAEHLLNTRPSAISLKNALRLTLGKASGKTVQDLKKDLTNRSKHFIDHSLKAVDLIGQHGSEIIHDQDPLLTHCHSSASTSVLIHAHERGKRIKVFSTETRPWDQGHVTVRELAQKGLHVTLIVDSAVRFIIKDENIKAVFVGADTIHSDGSVVNKIGTSQIALVAHESDIPFYVCAETYKFSPDSLRGERVEIEERDPSEIADPKDFPGVSFRNPVFDITPAEYVRAIITERGIISPADVQEIVREEFKEVEDWTL